MKFRRLKADEIEVRIGSVKENGLSLLLYKDARVDQNILDETVGSMNWQRHHSRDNANCIVSIWDSEKNQWIEKEDTGTERNTEKEKGLASDSFKRACFNWGIGRELYTSPFIWIPKGSFKDKYDRFKVQDIGYDENGCINVLKIYNIKLSKTVFTFGTDEGNKQEAVGSEEEAVANGRINQTKQNAFAKKCENDGVDMFEFLHAQNVQEVADITEMQFSQWIRVWDKIKERYAHAV